MLKRLGDLTSKKSLGTKSLSGNFTEKNNVPGACTRFCFT